MSFFRSILNVGRYIESPGGRTISRQRIRAKARKVNREIIGPEMVRMLRGNFRKGGDPKFAELKPLTLWMKKVLGFRKTTLVRTGQLWKKAIDNPVVEATYNEVRVRPRRLTAKMKEYINALHDGAEFSVPRTEKMRKFFWAMHYIADERGEEDIADAWKMMALSPKDTVDIKIPSRPWTHLTSTQKRKLHRKSERAWDFLFLRYARTGTF